MLEIKMAIKARYSMYGKPGDSVSISWENGPLRNIYPDAHPRIETVGVLLYCNVGGDLVLISADFTTETHAPLL